ncbi:unnamed protein product, partial [Menidia menidia]
MVSEQLMQPDWQFALGRDEFFSCVHIIKRAGISSPSPHNQLDIEANASADPSKRGSSEQMNVAILITVMSTLALALILDGAGAYNCRPCQRNYDNNAYNNFVRKHILQESFDRRSKSEWEGYIDRRGLCDRPYQTFIRSQDKRSVERICNGGGRQRSNNLCTSTSSIRVYDISVRPNDCKLS